MCGRLCGTTTTHLISNVGGSFIAVAGVRECEAGERRSAQVRRAVAANPNTPAAALASLAEDNDDEVRQAIAFNSATPPEVLIELAGSRMDLGGAIADEKGRRPTRTACPPCSRRLRRAPRRRSAPTAAGG
ncbi:hypothetical protein AB4Z38_23055 [Arthrobacter sp. 2RAF6]|uniref:hypothetical protein n=1 Tax=Arthrobacter sp. 2RAF6 TaxID=3233002 RepID=UPI003F907828